VCCGDNIFYSFDIKTLKRGRGMLSLLIRCLDHREDDIRKTIEKHREENKIYDIVYGVVEEGSKTGKIFLFNVENPEELIFDLRKSGAAIDRFVSVSK